MGYVRTHERTHVGCVRTHMRAHEDTYEGTCGLREDTHGANEDTHGLNGNTYEDIAVSCVNYQ